jgi:hypothetical protein
VAGGPPRTGGPPLEDRERALLIGEEFGLGTLEHLSRGRKFPKYSGWGLLLAPLVAIAALPVVVGVAGGPYTLTSKVVVAVVFGGLLAISCLVACIGIARSEVRDRLFRYSGGLAQLAHGELEPRVARWADVTEFTVTYYESEDTAARVSGFSVRTDTGTQLSSVRPYWGRSELRATVAEAEWFLAPRLVPELTEAYESGAPARFGRVRLSQAGISVRPPEDDLIPWAEIKSIHMTYIGAADYVHEIIIRHTGKPTGGIDVSGLPNGIFLPHVLAHAAAGQGVQVTGYRPGSFGQLNDAGS